MAQADRLGSFAEEIDQRRASELKGPAPHRRPPRQLPLKKEVDIEMALRIVQVKVVQIEEEELLRKCEVLLQQPVLRVGMARIGDHLLIGTEAYRTERALRQKDRAPAIFR
jgi:hypothetical protein